MENVKYPKRNFISKNLIFPHSIKLKYFTNKNVHGILQFKKNMYIFQHSYTNYHYLYT